MIRTETITEGVTLYMGDCREIMPTLRQLAREYPVSESAMDGIFGMGEKKRAEFGEVFAAEIASYLETNSRMSFG